MAATAVRIDQTTTEVDRLREEVSLWLSVRRGADELGNYRTQLGSLELFLNELIAATRNDADVDLLAPTGEIYDACRQIDGRVSFIRRFWTYFRERFDQRFESPLDPDAPEEPLTGAKILLAADEIVWSCWAEAHRRADPGRDPPAVPLPFVQSDVIPDATVRRLLPYELRPEDELLAAHVDALPIPTIGIPEVCIRHPWWLAYLAHEVGHHVHHELAGGILLSRFHELLIRATGDASSWPTRHEEVFADVFSVLTLGAPAAWALEELVISAPSAMVTGDSNYPSPLDRLELLWAVIGEAGGAAPGPGERHWQTIVADLGEAGDSHRRRIDISAIADRVVHDEMVGGQCLRDLAGWDGGWNATHGPALSTQLLEGRAPAQPDTSVRGARRAISAGVTAWQVGTEAGDPVERRTALRRLAETLVAYTRTCREPGTRAAQDAPKDTLVAQAGELTASLRRLRPVGAMFEGR